MDNTRNIANHKPQQPAPPIWLRAELVAVFVALFCYVNTVFNDFCDDGIPIVEANSRVNDPGQWSAIWTTDYWTDAKTATPTRDLLYRPVTLSSFRLVRLLGGIQAYPHLLFNILLHAINTAMVVRLCRHMGGHEAAALVAGAVFATLPIHTEVINNVVGRADLLATFGVLGAMLSHRRSMVATTEWGIFRWRGVAVLTAFIAMGSKESGVAVIGAIILLDGYWYRPWRAASRDRSWWNIRSLLRFAYLLVPLVVYLVLRYHALEGHLHQKPALTKTVNVLVDAPTWQHWLGVVQLWGMYWAKTVWPRVLCVNYSINTIRLATSLLDAQVILGLAVAVGLVVASVLSWRKGKRSIAFLCATTAITYAPTSNALVLIQVFFAERIWYLPSVFVTVLVGLAVIKVRWRPVWCLAGAVVVFAVIGRCWVRNAEWLNNQTLYAATYEAHRKAVGALRLYGQSLVEQGELEKGIELLERAIDVDLGFTDAHRSLGHAYLLKGNYEAARRHLQIANMQIPGHPPTVKAFEFVVGRLAEHYEAALEQLRLATEEDPHDVDREVAYLKKLQELGRLPQARARLQAGEERFAQSVQWQYQYAVTLVYLNQRDEAIARYAKCVELDPTNTIYTVELAMLLLERRQNDDITEAWKLADQAAAVEPDAPSVLVCRAELLALRGDLKAAGRLYRRAIESLPANSDQWRIFRERAAALGQ